MVHSHVGRKLMDQHSWLAGLVAWALQITQNRSHTPPSCYIPSGQLLHGRRTRHGIEKGALLVSDSVGIDNGLEIRSRKASCYTAATRVTLVHIATAQRSARQNLCRIERITSQQ